MLGGSDPDSHSCDPNILCRCMRIGADESATEMLSVHNSSILLSSRLHSGSTFR